MSYILEDSYTVDTDGTGILSAWKIAQGITPTSSYSAAGISLKLAGLTESATITGGIYATAAGAPTGSALASFSFAVTTAAAWISAVPISPALSFTSATTYAIVIDNPTVNIYWYGDTNVGSDDYTGGEPWVDLGGGWIRLSSPNWIDFAFKIYSSYTFAPPVPTGLNNMMTIRKLVAAANDKIWIEDI